MKKLEKKIIQYMKRTCNNIKNKKKILGNTHIHQLQIDEVCTEKHELLEYQDQIQLKIKKHTGKKDRKNKEDKLYKKTEKQEL